MRRKVFLAYSPSTEITSGDYIRQTVHKRGLTHNNYDQGSFLTNFQEVFGRDLPWYLSILPFKRKPPPMGLPCMPLAEAKCMVASEKEGVAGQELV